MWWWGGAQSTCQVPGPDVEAAVLSLSLSACQDTVGAYADARASSPSPAARPPPAATSLSGDICPGRINLLIMLPHHEVFNIRACQRIGSTPNSLGCPTSNSRPTEKRKMTPPMASHVKSPLSLAMTQKVN